MSRALRGAVDRACDAIDARRIWLRRVLDRVRRGANLRAAVFDADLEHEVDEIRVTRTARNTWPAQEINA
jgi:hypothetical protein